MNSAEPFATAVIAAMLVAVPIPAHALAAGDVSTVVGGGEFPVDGT